MSEYDPQLVFKESIDFIRDITGLELTLIEKVALRRMVVDAIERYNKTIHPKNLFHPDKEAVAQFMIQYYNCPAQTCRDIYCFQDYFGRYSADNRVYEYFRRKQDKMHLL